MICASRQVGKALQPPLTPISVAGPFKLMFLSFLSQNLVTNMPLYFSST